MMTHAQLKWVDALRYCSNNGKKLISIQSAAKMTQIKTFLPPFIGTSKFLNYLLFFKM